MNLTDLCNYYRDCLKADDLCVILQDNNGSFVEIEHGGTIRKEILRTEEIENFILKYNNVALKVGYPCYINNKGSHVPVFVFSVLIEKSDKMFVDLSSSSLNIKGLDEEKLLRADIEYDELINLEPEDLDFHNLNAIFESIFKCKTWLDNIEEAKVNSIINKSILFVEQNNSNFTKGLSRELKKLSSIQKEDFIDTALGKLLFINDVQNVIQNDCPYVYEVTPLNDEQKEAIKIAFTKKISLISGPPGTGKSQVITNFVVNAVLKGKRVLVVSKNNKAVDVVEKRLNALTEQPALLRLGSNKYATRLTEFITNILANNNKQKIKYEIDKANDDFEHWDDACKKTKRRIKEVIDLRNKVDELEQSVSYFRDEHINLFHGVGQIDVDQKELEYHRYREEVRLIDVDWSSFWNKLRWFFFKRKITRENNEFLDRFRRFCGDIGVEFNVEMASYRRENIGYYNKIVSDLKDRVDLIKKIKDYYSHLDSLLQQRPLEQLYDEERSYHEKKQIASINVWKLFIRKMTTIPWLKEREKIANVNARIKQAIDSDQFRSFNADDLALIAKYIPCWAITSLSVNDRIPFQACFFDYVVFDESSQCDIASALPLLYRTRCAIIVGDPKQLSHVSNLKSKEEEQLRNLHKFDNQCSRFSYICNSLYDCALPVENGAIHMLLNHYRSHPHIIHFSNKRFYDEKLRCATNPKFLLEYQNEEPGVVWYHVAGKTTRPNNNGAINRQEAKSVVSMLATIICQKGFQGSIGIVTPFRKQANLIRQLIDKNKNLWVNYAYNELLIDTAHKFQGDEKDIILFSPVVSDGLSLETTAKFLNGQENLFNVAITRARSKLIVVGNLQYCLNDNSVPFLHELAHYAERLRMNPVFIYKHLSNGHLASEIEKLFYEALKSAGVYGVLPQYSELGYSLDFAIILNEEKKLNIEIDGKMYHKSWNDSCISADCIRNEILKTNGWSVMRFWSYEVLDELPNCINRVKAWIEANSSIRESSFTLRTRWSR